MKSGIRSLAVFVLPAAALAAVLAAAGCASGGKGDAPREVTSFASAQAGLAALAGDWKIIEIDGRSLGEWIPDDAARRDPMITIRPDASVGGFSGVNQLGSDLRAEELSRGRFALGPIAMTRMAGPPELMSIESKLTLALSEPRRFSLCGDLLTLMPAEGRADPMLRFRRTPAAPARP